ncbi:unnamed protein product [Coccothraustes coccothraustes]
MREPPLLCGALGSNQHLWERLGWATKQRMVEMGLWAANTSKSAARSEPSLEAKNSVLSKILKEILNSPGGRTSGTRFSQLEK